MSPIVIRNIYYMFCYAWNRFQLGQAAIVGFDEESPDLLDLLTKALLHETSNILKRSLDKSYVEHQDDLANPKGRMLINDTLKRNLQQKRRISCTFDELDQNIKQNQIIKATLDRVSKTANLAQEHRRGAFRLKERFAEVSLVNVSPRDFHTVTLNRNNGHYAFILKLCELIYFSLLPEPNGTGYRFNSVIDNQKLMGTIFEDFVRNFYRIEQSVFHVGRENLGWLDTIVNDKDRGYLPQMCTDITLKTADRKIIIDTKFYRETLRTSYRGGEGSKKINSNHLYQLFSYLKNTKHSNSTLAPVEGMLLYPTASDDVSLDYKIQGHKVKIYALDLNRPWPGIKSDLINLLQ